MINAIRVSSSYFLVIILCVTAFSWGCKKVPSVSIDNKHDPENPNFKVAEVESITYHIRSREDVLLKWSYNSDAVFDGVELYRSIEDTTHFEKIFETTSNRANNFLDTPPRNSIKIFYKIVSFYDSQNKRKYSNPLYTAIEQDIPDFEAVHIDINTFQIRWGDNFKLNTTVNIYRIKGEESFTFLDSVSVFDNNFIDYFEDSVDSISYKLSIKNSQEEILEISSKVVSEYLSTPYISAITQISGTEVKLHWGNWEAITEIEFSLKPSHSNNAVRVATAAPEEKEVKIIGLDPNVVYELHVNSKRGYIYSTYTDKYLLKNENDGWTLKELY